MDWIVLDEFTAEGNYSFSLSVMSCHHSQKTWEVNQGHSAEAPFPLPSTL